MINLEDYSFNSGSIAYGFVVFSIGNQIFLIKVQTTD